MERPVLSNKVKEDKQRHTQGWGNILEQKRSRPMAYAKQLKLRFRTGDLDLPPRRNIYSTRSNREDEHVDAQIFSLVLHKKRE